MVIYIQDSFAWYKKIVRFNRFRWDFIVDMFSFGFLWIRGGTKLLKVIIVNKRILG